MRRDGKAGQVDVDRQSRDGMIVLVVCLALIGFSGLALGPSAAVFLATIVVILATFVSQKAALFARDDSEIHLALKEELDKVAIAGPTELTRPAALTFDEEIIAAMEATPAGAIAATAPGPDRHVRWRSGFEGSRGSAGSRLRTEVASASAISTLVSGVVAGSLGFMLFADLGDIPAGLFCDEAEIGVRTRELLHNQLTSFNIPFFYQHFAYTNFGTLPLLASAPFVALLGLSDFSIRLASLFWSIGANVLLIALVRRLGWSFGEIGVLAFAFSPVFIHVARLNFGHGPSLFCITAALYCYARAHDSPQWRWPLLAGIGFGLSVYGNLSYYLAAPVILAGLVLGELVVRRSDWKGYRRLATTLAATALVWVPVLIKALTDERFMDRFKDKDFSPDPLLSVDRMQTALSNYPKYFSSDYLFTKGESAMPGGFISRHSVIGAGELTWILLPLVVAGIVAVFRIKEPRGRLFGVVGLTTLVLYPVPDILTTGELNPPYTFAIFSTMISVAILASLGMHWLIQLARQQKELKIHPGALSAVVLAIVVVGGVRFYAGPYQDYPDVSAGYYGWQYGPRQAIDAFKEYDAIYDRFLLDGDFNEAHVFLDFYLADDEDVRAKSVIGGFDQVTLSRHELFAIRRERYDEIMMGSDRIRLYTRVVDVIRYPAGEIAMYLVDVSPRNYRGIQGMPR